jgi:hypothetical protein
MTSKVTGVVDVVLAGSRVVNHWYPGEGGSRSVAPDWSVERTT